NLQLSDGAIYTKKFTDPNAGRVPPFYEKVDQMRGPGIVCAVGSHGELHYLACRAHLEQCFFWALRHLDSSRAVTPLSVSGITLIA
ncbi:hypothetical protein, partial [Sodalis sp.]|uniref:hypothetical protein n=1 Tax=Sodalis sp. (in: enterobacteria) TaxID=1898979 RepID=UPI003873965B